VKNLHLFGELASDKRGHPALVRGALVSLDPKADLSLFYRNIAKEYQAPFGNAFTENTLPSNEEGLYAGFQLRPATGWQMAAYADFYRFPFIKYRVSSPTQGCDYLAQLNYAPDKRTEIYLRYRTGTKPSNETGTASAIRLPVDQVKQSLRLHFATQLHATVSLRGRSELLWFTRNGNREEGFLTYLETACEPSAKWKGSLRLQYFETGGYDSRIYAYESDVLYSFSIPAFFDKGFRYYLNLSCSLGKRLVFWLRFAQTAYRDKTSVGSGLDETPGNRKSEVKCQVRYLF
jgi:hypothetical protein